MVTSTKAVSSTSAFSWTPPRLVLVVLVFAARHRGGDAFSLRMAAGGPPAYDKRPATLVSNEEVGRAARVLRLRCDDDEPLEYEPGHVMAVEMRDETTGEWSHVGPYTVSRCDRAERTIDVCYRVVGRKTEAFAAADPETSRFRFGGTFKVPIGRGVAREDDVVAVDRVVGLSTGVGVGPLLGFAEKAMDNEPYRVDLFALFREEEDATLRSDLDALAKRCPDRFSWTPVFSESREREDLAMILAPLMKCDTTHVHLIGNGSMVNEWTAGLKKAGVGSDRVTTEIYFNHRVEPRTDMVEAIATAMIANAELSVAK